MTNNGYCGSLIDDIGDKFRRALWDLKAPEIEKIHAQFVTKNVTGLKIAFEHGRVVFRLKRKFKLINCKCLRYCEDSTDCAECMIKLMIRFSENDYYWNPN